MLIEISEKGGLFRNRRFTKLKKFDSQDVVEWIKPALSIRNAVNNTLGSLNTQEWIARISVFNSEDFLLLTVIIAYYSTYIIGMLSIGFSIETTTRRVSLQISFV